MCLHAWKENVGGIQHDSHGKCRTCICMHGRKMQEEEDMMHMENVRKYQVVETMA